MAELTDEQIKLEEQFMEGIPRINIGALVLAPVWGPGHGIWATILLYPLWLFIDNAIYAAWTERTIFASIVAGVLIVSVAVGMVVFSLVSQPYAAHKAAEKGISKEKYLKRERIWAVVCIVLGIAALTWATYYNLMIRPTLGG